MTEGNLKFNLSNAAKIRQFKTAVQSLAKIGSELLVEGIPERLVLRCINTSKSAFMAMSFQEHFFESYQVFNSTVVQAGVLMKHVLACFRTQKLNKMTVELDLQQNTLSTTLICDKGMVKKYCLHCIDSEILQATVDRESFPTHVVAEAKELNRLLSSFQSSLEEITVISNPETASNPHNACRLQSFIDPSKVHSDNALRTSIQLDTHSMFLSYEHRSDSASDVTFNLKDFRALVGFCEAIGANVSLRFEGPGMPLLAEPNFHRGLDGGDFTAELVLATLMESQIGQPVTTPSRAPRTPGDVPGDTPFRTPAAAAAGQQSGHSTGRKANGLRSLRTGATSGADRRSRLARAAACPTQPDMDVDKPAQGPGLLHFNADPAHAEEQPDAGMDLREEEDGVDGTGVADDDEDCDDVGDMDDDIEGLPAARLVPDDFDEGQDGDEFDEELPATPPETYPAPAGPVIIG